MSENRPIAAPRFTLEFPDKATLEAACKQCLDSKVARVPAVQTLEAGDRCELAFVTADGDDDEPEAVLAGVVSEVVAEPPGIVVEVRARRRQPPRTTDPNAELRGLPLHKAVKLARTSGQRERTVLERTYGKAVWQALLNNPKITIPEVARIARKRAIPQPLLASIVDNATWATSPVVRRAILANPRITTAMASTLLRMCPRNELKLATKQTAYPMNVRQMAQRLLDG